jgi:L-rhamnose mutarotase
VERVCFELRVRPERLEEYRERHAAVWPEMLAALRAAGWGNYSLFSRGDGQIVGYLETEDFAAAQRKLAALSAILEGDPDAKALRAVVDSWQQALEELQRDLPDRRAFVADALQRAETLREADPAAARKLIEGLVELYGSDPAVADLLDGVAPPSERGASAP